MRQGYTVPRPYIQWCALDAFITQCKSACGVLEPTRNSKAYNIGIYTAVNNAKARTWGGMATKGCDCLQFLHISLIAGYSLHLMESKYVNKTENNK